MLEPLYCPRPFLLIGFNHKSSLAFLILHKKWPFPFSELLLGVVIRLYIGSWCLAVYRYSLGIEGLTELENGLETLNLFSLNLPQTV